MVKCKRHYVEIGRVIYLRFGRYKDTLAVITDVIDQNWVLADGRAFPGGMMRAPVNLKDISLTHLKLKMGHGLRHQLLRELVAKEDVVNKWSKTTVARRLEKQTNKRNSTDLERWRIQHNRRQRSYLIKVKFNKLKKRAQKIAEEKHAKKSKRERPAKVKKTEKKKKDLPKKSPEAPPAKAKKTSKKGDASKKAKGKQLSAHEEEVFTNAKINFKAMHAWQGRCLPANFYFFQSWPKKELLKFLQIMPLSM